MLFLMTSVLAETYVFVISLINKRMIWESDLSGFSNVDKIIKHLDYGMFIPKLFEKGLLT